MPSQEKARGLRPRPVGVRGFKSRPPHFFKGDFMPTDTKAIAEAVKAILDELREAEVRLLKI